VAAKPRCSAVAVKTRHALEFSVEEIPYVSQRQLDPSGTTVEICAGFEKPRQVAASLAMVTTQFNSTNLIRRIKRMVVGQV